MILFKLATTQGLPVIFKEQSEREYVSVKSHNNFLTHARRLSNQSGNNYNKGISQAQQLVMVAYVAMVQGVIETEGILAIYKDTAF